MNENYVTQSTIIFEYFTKQNTTVALYMFTGRKGPKKGGGILLAAGAAMATMMAQAAMGKIALIAGKALVIAKVALAISAIIGLKKLFSSSGGESHQVVYATGGHDHGGWQGRAFTSDHPQAHDLAYKAQKPENTGDE
jgi:hypothetical protein